MRSSRVALRGAALALAAPAPAQVRAERRPRSRALPAACTPRRSAATSRRSDAWLRRASADARTRATRTAARRCTSPRSRGSATRSALLAKAGADLDLLENDRYDAVTIASVADDEETLRVLLALGASAKLVTSRYDGTALIAAAHLGHDGVVRQLIAAGAPLDHVNNLHWTALIESIVLGDGGPRHQAHAAGAGRRRRQPAAGRPPGQHAAAAGAGARLRRDGATAGIPLDGELQARPAGGPLRSTRTRRPRPADQ